MEHVAQCLQADKEQVLFSVFIKKSSVLVQCVMSNNQSSVLFLFIFITVPKQE